MSSWLAIEVARKRRVGFRKSSRGHPVFPPAGNFAPSPGYLPRQSPAQKQVRRDLARLLGRHPAATAIRLLLPNLRPYTPPSEGEWVPNPADGWYVSGECALPAPQIGPPQWRRNISSSPDLYAGWANGCLGGQTMPGDLWPPTFLSNTTNVIKMNHTHNIGPGNERGQVVKAWHRDVTGPTTAIELPGAPMVPPVYPRPARVPLEVDNPWYDPAVIPPLQPAPANPRAIPYPVIPARPDFHPNRPERERTDRGNGTRNDPRVPPVTVTIPPQVDVEVDIKPETDYPPLPSRPRRGEREVKVSFRSRR